MTTTAVTLTQDAWTDLGAGPLTITSNDLSDTFEMKYPICFHIGTVAPSINSTAFHQSNGLTYTGTKNVYARARRGTREIIYTPEN